MYLSLYRLKPIYSNIVLSLFILALLLSPFFGKGVAAAPAGSPEAIADLGDAPDNTNNHGEKMTTYPSDVVANFPTTYYNDPTDPGPYHYDPRGFAWLGKEASMEADADLDPALDEDGVINIDPPANRADQDSADDGIHLPLQMPTCGYTTLDYDINAINQVDDWPLNVWFDFNRDGDWEDTLECQDAQGNGIKVPEWAVQNEIVNAKPDYTTLTTVPFAVMDPPTPDNPMWMRVTFTTEPAPPSPISGVPAGGGPSGGYKYGETEDYYLQESILPGQPDLAIQKSAAPVVFQAGDYADYALTVTNIGNGPATTPIELYDILPTGVTLVSVSAPAPWSCLPSAPTLYCTHPGPINPGASATIVIKVAVAPTAVPGVVNCAAIKSDNESDYTNNEACIKNEVRPAAEADAGDAPDNTNHVGIKMTTYPNGVPANFPTVFDNPTTSIPGPLHWQATKDAWLGQKVSSEKDADLLPDSDLVGGQSVTNLAPATNLADRDGYDDGVILKTLLLPECQTTTFQYSVTVVGAKKTRYTNAWFDFNHDGDWEDSFTCLLNRKAYKVTEWAVRNQTSSLKPGNVTLTTPTFRSTMAPTSKNPMWMRIMLSESKAVMMPRSSEADGRGPAAGYQYGETEDYLLTTTIVKANLQVTSAQAAEDEAFDEPAEGVVIDEADIISNDEQATKPAETDGLPNKAYLPLIES